MCSLHLGFECQKAALPYPSLRKSKSEALFLRQLPRLLSTSMSLPRLGPITHLLQPTIVGSLRTLSTVVASFLQDPVEGTGFADRQQIRSWRTVAATKAKMEKMVCRCRRV